MKQNELPHQGKRIKIKMRQLFHRSVFFWNLLASVIFLSLCFIKPVKADLLFRFANSTLTGSADDELIFSGNIQNTGPMPVSLNAVSINIVGLPSTIDTSLFFANTPATLEPNSETGIVPLFAVTILPGASTGEYNGVFQIEDDLFQPLLADSGQSFRVLVPGTPIIVAEPAVTLLILSGLIPLLLFVQRRWQEQFRIDLIRLPAAA